MNPLQHILILAVRAYRWTISPAQVFLFGSTGGCRFTPTCSNYALDAVRERGALTGTALAAKRICRCHPWGGWARIVFRFFPNGSNPNESLMDVMLLAPWPEGKPKPPAAKLKLLGVDESWTTAPELCSLAKIIDQDCLNLPYVQEGLTAKQPPRIWLAAYQESKIRNFHHNYNRARGISDDA